MRIAVVGVGRTGAFRARTDGYQVQSARIGETGCSTVGLGPFLALRSLEPGITFPSDPAFVQRFAPAYRAEAATFCDVTAGRATVPCTVDDALAAFRVADASEASIDENRPIEPVEIPGAA